MARNRTVLVESVAVRRRVSQRQYKGGRVLYIVRFDHLFTLTEGHDKPRFTFESGEADPSLVPGQWWRARTCEWTKDQYEGCPSVEMVEVVK